jgi:hypothetical protein
LSGAKGKASDLRQPIEADPDDPRQVDIEDVLAEPAAPTQAEIVRANLARIDAPEAKDWHRALEALRGMKTPCRGRATGGGLKCGA